MSLVVKPARTRGERKQFLEFPWTIYRGDPYWIPPLRTNQKELVGYKKHPFHDIADVETFLAYDGGRVVGRVAAIWNRAHLERHKDDLGFFGFFESVDDPRVATALFDAARAWLTAKGAKKIRGPVNPSLNYETGLLVEGFQNPPAFMMTYNPPYYARLVEQYGFQKAQDLFAYGGTVDMLDGLDKKMMFVADESRARFNIVVRPVDKKRFQAEIITFLELYNQSLGGTWGFVPLSADEVRHMSKQMKWLINPEMAMIAEVDGKPIGAVLCLPDYNPRIKAIDGRLFPLGIFKLLSRKPFDRIRIISANVIPEYQCWGVGLVLVKSLIPAVLNTGIREAEFSWVLETNNLSRKSLERGGALLTKTYRLYDLG